MPEPPYLVLDLAGVVSWDGSGLGAMLSSVKDVRESGGCVAVARAPSDLVAHCRRVGLNRVFECHATVESAVTALRPT
ncbi:STAS domain-containing protein [Herbidospora yilanensis]|uniref:STAS domain-containing protein n=1 Tax=Herbidospora yilanensis TaxID=354426 RepID=UPI0034E1A457